MDKKYDVVALGELLIDFTENGLSDQGNMLMEANPGGAPCNVLSMLKKLGRSCAFIGKVGDDIFGNQLSATIAEAGIDNSSLLIDPNVRTTLAFVKTYEDGDRDFSFYRNPGADMMLRADELPTDMLKSTKVFHFGTLSMTHPDVREATKTAVRTAKDAGAIISFDPNLRPPLWNDLDEAKEQMEWGLSVCDMLKIADNEGVFLTGENDPKKAAEILHGKYPNIRMFNITLGPEGSYHEAGDESVFVPAYKLGGTIETTGAGDVFGACMIDAVIRNGLTGMNKEGIEKALKFANAAAYIITTRKGALRVMPERSEIEAVLAGK